MKKARYIVLVLLSSLLIMLMGCERRELLDNYPVSGVQVKIDWSGVTDKLPEGMKIIFYPKDDEGRKVESYLSVKGGEVLKVPPGRYAVVIYNYDTESVCIRGEELFETIEAYTKPCKLDIAGTEDAVWNPDPLYVVSVDNLEVADSEEVLEIGFKPQAVVQSRSFTVKAEGLNNVAAMAGIIRGMANCYFLGGGKSKCDAFPIYVELSKGDGVIEGTFTTFGLPDMTETRAGSKQVIMTLILVRVDNVPQEAKVDVTTIVNTPLPLPPGEGGETPPVDIEMPPGEEIVVEDVKPEPPGGGGGIGGDVGDWGEEDNVELPVN